MGGAQRAQAESVTHEQRDEIGRPCPFRGLAAVSHGNRGIQSYARGGVGEAQAAPLKAEDPENAR